jgi:hypothetical protein
MRRRVGKLREKNSYRGHSAPFMERISPLPSVFRGQSVAAPYPDETATAAALRVASVVGERLGPLAKVVRDEGSQ